MTTTASVSSVGSDNEEDAIYVQVERKSKLLPFNPKKSVWRIWSKQFLQRANERGYKKILVGEQTVVNGTIASTLPKTDARYKLYQLNQKAYGDLMMCFMDDVNFGILEDAVSSDLELGCARTA
jgi:hypothetical protein